MTGRSYFILFDLFLISLSGSCQLIGTYEQTERLNYISVSLSDTGFVKTTGHALNHGSVFSKGKYILKGDTLILNSIPWKGKTSSIQILSKKHIKNISNEEIDTELINLSISVIDEMKSPIPQSLIYLKNNNEEIIAIVLSDKEGNFFLSSSTSFVNNLLIGHMGYMGFDLNLEDFRGNSSEVEIMLKSDDQNIYNSKKFIDYYIYDKENSSIIPLSNNEMKQPLYRRKNNR